MGPRFPRERRRFPYFGAILIAPSSRMVSAFSISISTIAFTT
jgi:hypothetical protein